MSSGAPPLDPRVGGATKQNVTTPTGSSGGNVTNSPSQNNNGVASIHRVPSRAAGNLDGDADAIWTLKKQLVMSKYSSTPIVMPSLVRSQRISLTLSVNSEQAGTAINMDVSLSSSGSSFPGSSFSGSSSSSEMTNGAHSVTVRTFVGQNLSTMEGKGMKRKYDGSGPSNGNADVMASTTSAKNLITGSSGRPHGMQVKDSMQQEKFQKEKARMKSSNPQHPIPARVASGPNAPAATTSSAVSASKSGSQATSGTTVDPISTSRSSIPDAGNLFERLGRDENTAIIQATLLKCKDSIEAAIAQSSSGNSVATTNSTNSKPVEAAMGPKAPSNPYITLQQLPTPLGKQQLSQASSTTPQPSTSQNPIPSPNVLVLPRKRVVFVDLTGSDDDSEMKEECTICTNEYDSFIRNPQLWEKLKCGHKLCVSCYNNIKTVEKISERTSYTSIKCPFCKDLSLWSVTFSHGK